MDKFTGLFFSLLLLTQSVWAHDRVEVSLSGNLPEARISLNGRFYGSVSPENGDLYWINAGSSWQQGISLLEILPLMEETELLRVTFGEGEREIRGDDLAEFFGEGFLLVREGGFHLYWQNHLYRDLTGLTLEGTLLEKGELELWLSWEGVDHLKEEIDSFARRHGLTVRAVEVPRPDSKLISVQRARGRVPDLLMIQSSAVEELVRSRAIQSLDNIRLPETVPQGAGAFTLEDRLWGAPFYFDTQIVFCNPRLMTPPAGEWTLTDLERLCGEMKRKGITPAVWNAYSSNWLIPFQASFGKEELINPRGTVTVNDPASLHALEYILDLQEKGFLVPMERDAMDALFISGKIGLILSGSYAIPYFESLGIPFTPVPYPVNGTTGRPVAPLLDFKAFCITKRTREPLLARRMLQYLCGPGFQQRFAAEYAKISGRRDMTDFPHDPGPYREILADTVPAGMVIPPERVYRIYKNHMWKLLRFALSGQMAPQEVLDQGQRLMNSH